MEKKNYYFFDILKIVFSFFVVAIHTKILHDSLNTTFSWYIMNGLFRLAVPSFFVISGFFYGKKIYQKKYDEQKEICKKYIKRLLIPFCFWLILNLPFQFIEYYRGMSLRNNIIRIVKGLFFYPWGAMWYVLALIIAVLLIYLLSKKISLKKIFIISIFLYLFALLCTNYYFVFKNTFIGRIAVNYCRIFISARNGLFEGLLFVTEGILIYNYYAENNVNYRRCLLLVILSYALLVIEIFLIKGQSYLDDGSLYIMLVIFIPLLILYGTKFVEKKDTLIIRNYSTAIYFMHIFFIATVEELLRIFNVNYSRWLEFGLVTVLLLLVITILHFINNKKINKLIF